MWLWLDYLEGEASSQLVQGKEYPEETTQYTQSFTLKVSISAVVLLLLSQTFCHKHFVTNTLSQTFCHKHFSMIHVLIANVTFLYLSGFTKLKEKNRNERGFVLLATFIYEV